MSLACPGERGFHERQALVAHAGVTGFVVDVPAQHARVVVKAAHHLPDVGLEPGPAGAIQHALRAGAGCPAVGEFTGDQLRLSAKERLRHGAEGAIVEENEERADAVLLREGEELVDACLESSGIVIPDEVLQEHAGAVEAGLLGQGQFRVDGFRVERVGLPHLRGVDGRGGDVVEADQPRLRALPDPCAFRCPSTWNGGARSFRGEGLSGQQRADRETDCKVLHGHHSLLAFI
jgi:hypothetical protein